MDAPAVGRPDRSDNLINDAVRVLMRVSDLKREVLSAQIGLEHVGSVRPEPTPSSNLVFAAPRLCNTFSRYQVSLSPAMIARSAFGTVISSLSRGEFPQDTVEA